MPEEKSSAGARIAKCGLLLAVLGGVGVGLWYALGQPSAEDLQNLDFGDIGADWNWTDFGDFSDVLPNLTDIDIIGGFQGDPFVGDNSTQGVWRHPKGEGLTLTMLNALDDSWQDEFAMAVSDWDNGDPDALTLKTEKGQVDHQCEEPVDGKMKVCNGNFGETGWLGINEIVSTVQTNEILSSVAKMNEWYLNNADPDERQYTMCHEVGHGFGLPHTDENFNNPDLGNCLDYTVRPRNNLHPDGSNYQRLASIYGTVGGGGSRRNKLRRQLQHSSTRRRRVLSQNVKSEYQEAMKEFHEFDRRKLSTSSWELLESHERGSLYRRRLGKTLQLHVHTLHPRP